MDADGFEDVVAASNYGFSGSDVNVFHSAAGVFGGAERAASLGDYGRVALADVVPGQGLEVLATFAGTASIPGQLRIDWTP